MRHVGYTLLRWLDAGAGVDRIDPNEPLKVDWLRTVPFFAMHAACLGAIWVGWSWAAVVTAVALYVVRMFFITAFYHRYFSHRAFQTTRAFQCVMAVAGLTAVQRGPLWWAAHHRHHHTHSDTERDPHSPRHLGFWWSHMGWFTARPHFPTQLQRVRDLARYPELRLLDRFDAVVYLVFAAAVFGFGWLLQTLAPQTGTSGLQMLVWGFFISTVAVYHGTYTINSLAHRFGRQRYATDDDSRNSLLLAVVTLGEGWHNNHHHYPVSARQGFFWWEWDPTYYLLVALSWTGLIWDLRPVPEQARDAAHVEAGGGASSPAEHVSPSPRNLETATR